VKDPESMRTFKRMELFSSLRIRGTKFIAIRCDGRCFHELTERLGFSKPYDLMFARIMVYTVISVMSAWRDTIRIGYTFSDEINYILKEPFPFSGRLEKLISLIASTTGSAFTNALMRYLGKTSLVQFDARIIWLSDLNDVVDYLYSRQREAWRNFINSVSYYMLIKKGIAPKDVEAMLRGMSALKRINLLAKYGVDIHSFPTWMMRGILVHLTCIKKIGFNPITKEQVKTYRRIFKITWSLPSFKSDEGRILIRDALNL